jgi:hypothetical protein
MKQLKQTKMSFVFFYKNGEQEGKTGPVSRTCSCEQREDTKKGCRRVNMVDILCTCVKMEN